VTVAGDQVVAFRRSFKLPEDWTRAHESSGIVNWILTGFAVLFGVAVTSVLLGVFVVRVRSGRIPWLASGEFGVVIAILAGVAALCQLAVIDRAYDTSIPLSTFHLFAGVGLFIQALFAGLGGWLVLGFVASLYPESREIFNPSARRLWRRDAAIGVALAAAAIAAAARIDALITQALHVFAPADVDFSPNSLDVYAPGLSVFSTGLLGALAIMAAVAVFVYLVRSGRNTAWIWAGGVALLIVLGPVNAQSAGEFATGWLLRFVPVALAVFVIAVFFRDNVAAYAGAALVAAMLNPTVAFFTQHAAFYKWNGILVVALLIPVLGWLLPFRSKPSTPAQDA
jgi:hypothetical protein